MVERAVILAGGKGTRLAPYTVVLPKPLMPVGDVAILEIVLRQLRYFGVRQATIAVGYLAELLMAYLHDGEKLGIAIDYSREDRPLGTAGPLKLIRGLNKTFLVMNGDLLTSLDYRKLVAFHREKNALATIGIFSRPVSIDLGIVEIDHEHRLRNYIEKPTLMHHVSMGVYVFEPQVLEYIPHNERLDFPDLIHRLLNAQRPVYGYVHNGYWLDLGRKEDYEQAVNDFQHMRSTFLPDEHEERDSTAHDR